jgi:hypothetical protein
MDMINIAIARDVSNRALLGARLDDPVVPEAPSLLSRGAVFLQGLARRRRTSSSAAVPASRRIAPR